MIVVELLIAARFVVCMFCSSFDRFGSLQLPAVRGDFSLLQKIADFAATLKSGAVHPDISPYSTLRRFLCHETKLACILFDDYSTAGAYN